MSDLDWGGGASLTSHLPCSDPRRSAAVSFSSLVPHSDHDSVDDSQIAAESVVFSLPTHLQERRSFYPPGATSSVFQGHGALMLGNLRVGWDPGDGLSTPGLVTAPECTCDPCVCPGTQGLSSVQSLSCVRLCDPMDCSMPGLPVHHQLPEFTQTHVH